MSFIKQNIRMLLGSFLNKAEQMNLKLPVYSGQLIPNVSIITLLLFCKNHQLQDLRHLKV